MTTRRTFLATIPAGALALGLRNASAAPAALSETDPSAVALGYKADAKKVDIKKYPAYVSAHKCANCKLYAGKPSDPAAPCGIFPGKLVNGKGWCVAWAAKA
jgi:hypothetical protein